MRAMRESSTRPEGSILKMTENVSLSSSGRREHILLLRCSGEHGHDAVDEVYARCALLGFAVDYGVGVYVVVTSAICTPTSQLPSGSGGWKGVVEVLASRGSMVNVVICPRISSRRWAPDFVVDAGIDILLSTARDTCRGTKLGEDAHGFRRCSPPAAAEDVDNLALGNS